MFASMEWISAALPHAESVSPYFYGARGVGPGAHRAWRTESGTCEYLRKVMPLSVKRVTLSYRSAKMRRQHTQFDRSTKAI